MQNESSTTVNLNDQIEDISSGSSVEESDSESESGSGEDDISLLSSKNDRLKEVLRNTKAELAETKRNLTLTNNLRVAYLKEVKELRVKVENQCKEINTLRENNYSLQYIITSSLSGKLPNCGPVKYKAL